MIYLFKRYKIINIKLFLLLLMVSPDVVRAQLNLSVQRDTYFHTKPYCSNIRSSDKAQGITAPGDMTVAVSRIVQNCIGSIEAKLTGFGNDLSFTRMQLQQKISGDWVVLDQGKNIVYKADPGIYRIVVLRSDADGNSTRWEVNYSLPRI